MPWQVLFNATSSLSDFLLTELAFNAPSEMSKWKVTFPPDSLCPVHEPSQEVSTEAACPASPLTRHLLHTQATPPIAQQLQWSPNLSPKSSSPTVRDQTIISSGLPGQASLHTSENKPRVYSLPFPPPMCLLVSPASVLVHQMVPTISELLSVAVTSCMWLLRNASVASEMIP